MDLELTTLKLFSADWIEEMGTLYDSENGRVAVKTGFRLQFVPIALIAGC